LADAPPQSRHRLSSLGAGRRNPFPAALKHTARVARLKRGIVWSLAGAAVLGVAFAAFQFLRFLPVDLRFAHVALEGTRITIQTPKIVGYRRDGTPYELRAKVGVQDVSKPDQFELEGLEVKLDSGNQPSIMLTAANGVYDAKTDRADLGGGVRIYDGKNFDLALDTAAMDFKAATLTSDRRGTLKLDGMEISANEVTFLQNERQATFVGDTHTVLYGEKDESETEAAPDPAPALKETKDP